MPTARVPSFCDKVYLFVYFIFFIHYHTAQTAKNGWINFWLTYNKILKRTIYQESVHVWPIKSPNPTLWDMTPKEKVCVLKVCGHLTGKLAESIKHCTTSITRCCHNNSISKTQSNKWEIEETRLKGIHCRGSVEMVYEKCLKLFV